MNKVKNYEMMMKQKQKHILKTYVDDGPDPKSLWSRSDIADQILHTVSIWISKQGGVQCRDLQRTFLFENSNRLKVHLRNYRHQIQRRTRR